MLVELLLCACHFLVILADHHHFSHCDRVVTHAAITLVYVIFDTIGAVSSGLRSNHSNDEGPLVLAMTELQSADKPIDIEVGHYSDLSGNQEEVGRISLN